MVDDGEPDEFPSEATRIDPNAMAGAAQTPARRPAAASPFAKPEPAAPAERKRPERASRPPPDEKSAKLAALQSLSLNAPPSASRLPPAPGKGGSATLPWTLFVLTAISFGGYVAYTKNALPFLPQKPTNAAAAGATIRTEVVTPTGGVQGGAHNAAGFTAARTPISVGVPVGGRIKDMKVNNGDKVKRGQVIVFMDDSAAQADMAAVNAEVRDAERNLGQVMKLFKAQAATSVDVSRAQGQVDLAKAKRHPISARIEQARIKSPIDGTVLERIAQPGETVAINAPVIKLADDQLVAEVDIAEGDLKKIRRGQKVDVTSESFPDKVFKGVVREIAEQADKSRGTVQVKVDLAVPDQSLRPGMSVKCAFLPPENPGDEKPRIYISKSAVTPQSTVWVVAAGNRVTSRPVTTQAGVGSSVEVLTGLNGGERIVVDAAQVHEGQVLEGK